MSESDVIDVSVILVTWNALDVTAAALESLQTHTSGVTYEVFVIDNGTTKDSSVTELPRRFPWIHFIANNANLGFTKANNIAIKQARGRHVLLLNSDTIQTENAIGEAVRYMDAHPDVGVLGIMHRNNDPERSFQPSAHRFPKPLHEIQVLYGLGRHADPYPAQEMDVDWVCGSFLLIRRATLEQVGPMDERFFTYNEDIDWCQRITKAGWKIRYWPGARMIHIGSSASPFVRDKTSIMFRSHLTYLRKHHGIVIAALFYLAMGFKLILAAIKQLVLWAIGRSAKHDIKLRWQRLKNFVFVQPSKSGI